MLNKSKGNMYSWVTHTWNVVKGKCPHDCSYCYMKRYPQAQLRFDGGELETDLAGGNTIFVGSSCDMWAEDISTDQIAQILGHCRGYSNKYLFQTKNPQRWLSFRTDLFPLPQNIILGTTIESNREYVVSLAPMVATRYQAMRKLLPPRMVSIEPVMDFDLDVMVNWMQEINPQFISIGADSGNNHLPEPTPDKVKALIEALKEFTEVKVKDNLKRIIGAE